MAHVGQRGLQRFGSGNLPLASITSSTLHVASRAVGMADAAPLGCGALLPSARF